MADDGEGVPEEAAEEWLRARHARRKGGGPGGTSERGQHSEGGFALRLELPVETR